MLFFRSSVIKCLFVYTAATAFKANCTICMFGNDKTYFIVDVGPI